MEIMVVLIDFMISSSNPSCQKWLSALVFSALSAMSAAAQSAPAGGIKEADPADARPRSARILSDEYFFDAAFGAEQIVALGELINKRDRSNFVTTGRFDKKPKLNEIVRRYGEPDLVVATKEFYLEGDGATSYTVTAYYDRVGFSVYGKHQRSQTVHIVTLQYHDFTASLRPAKGKFFYEIVTSKNRVFYSDGKEVGLHVYTDRLEWTTLGGIPAGEYVTLGDEAYGKVQIDKDGNGKLFHYYPNGSVRERIQFANGKYHGRLQGFSEQGRVARESFYQDGRMHGKSQRFYENGLKQAEAYYYHGRIHGRAQEFHPNGTVRLRMDYAYGNPVSPLEEFDEAGKLVRSSESPDAVPPTIGKNTTGDPAAPAETGSDQPLRKGRAPAS